MKADNPTVVFILGGPGSGKGTQSQLIHKNYNFVHLSAGDLLRAERKKEGSKNGALIQQCIVQGNIVPSQITVALLQQAMKENGWEKSRFLVDGFPRNWQNFQQWNKMMGEKVSTPFLIFLDCSQDCMLKRLQKRSETSGRSDDNIDSIKKRFVTYKNETMPVIQDFKDKGKCIQAQAECTVDEVYTSLSKQFKERGVE